MRELKAGHWLLAPALLMGLLHGCRLERPFSVDSACIPESIPARSSFQLHVFSSCSASTKFKELECQTTVRGSMITVRTPARRAKEPMRRQDECVSKSITCEIPGLEAGTYALEFDDWTTTLVVANNNPEEQLWCVGSDAPYCEGMCLAKEEFDDASAES